MNVVVRSQRRALVSALLASVALGCGAGGNEGPRPEPSVVASPQALALPSAMKLELGELPSVSNAWLSVPLERAYTSMVVVATPAYGMSSVPLVTRIRNAAGSSFELRVDRFDGKSGGVPGVPVAFLVVESGVYSAATHGIKMEAVRFNSTVTDNHNSWVGQARSYQNSYTAPVVLGQVLSYADSRPSVFWSRGSSSSSPPSATTLRVGKHVGEDFATSRSNETLGYVVIEAGSGLLGSAAFEARLGSDTIVDVTQTPGSYPLTAPGPASLAVLSQSGMDGGDGSWAVLAGTGAASGPSLRLQVDEDNVRDSERSHSSEQVAYFAVNPCPSPAAAGAFCRVGGVCAEDGSCCADTDGDRVCDSADACLGFDDHSDADGDGSADGCDGCPNDAAKLAPGACGCGNLDTDSDGDGAADCVDPCPLDNPDDADLDGVCSSQDRCPGFDDGLDSDANGVPDGCQACFSAADCDDGNECTTSACDALGQCAFTPVATEPAVRCAGGHGLCVSDGTCYACPDSDGDFVCDVSDVCPGFDDAIDPDADGTPSGCDACPNDNPNDSDGDLVCNSADRCPGFDDRVDVDQNGIPDGCQECVTAAACDDGNACTTDACVLAACTHTIAQGQSCGAGKSCDASGQCVGPTCVFKALGDLPGGQFNSAAFAVSDDGRTVTGRTHVGTGIYKSYRWTEATGMVGMSSGTTSSGRGISADGKIIVGIGGSEVTYSSQFAFRERPTFIETTSTRSTVAKAVSADGAVVVGDRSLEAFRWPDGSSPLSLGLGAGSTANAISADGSKIVGRGSVPGRSSGGEAFVWTATGVAGLGDLSGNSLPSSEAYGISPSGNIVVGVAAGPNSVTHGFLWTASGGLSSIGVNFTPRAVTDAGMIVGASGSTAYVKQSSRGDGTLKAVLEACGLSLTGWSLTEANDVTPDGTTIVGTGLNPSGNFEAYLARLPP